MNFIADFHIHSKFSRATAKNLDFENLYIAARTKGITVVGTGDFTHPEWFEEIIQKLEPAEPGLFKLKDDIAKVCDQQLPLSCPDPVRFILTCEISNIYKKYERVRKNHNLVFMPTIESVSLFNSKLESIGNIKSDGRPILGLDARDLLEIVLETDESGFLVPAHIWTPWFSVFGSRSGFDSLEECFQDMTPYVFAAETGLSSDPAMNWRVSDLDKVTMISNSDAHSPSKLGREANLFDTDLSYQNIKTAIKTGDSFLGTLEMYSEEGKYHMDGHRKCGICFTPKQSIAHEGICPVCNRPLTLGVLYRVNELSDRGENEKPKNVHPFYSLIPLEEIISEIFQVGPKSKKVQTKYNNLIEALGPELKILHSIDVDYINQKSNMPLLGEAIARMRQKQVHIFPGYDGEYGKIKVFTPKELEQLLGQQTFGAMDTPVIQKKPKKQKSKTLPVIKKKPISQQPLLQDCKTNKKISNDNDILKELNKDQYEAVTCDNDGPVLIIAGPGTGKTRTLTYRIAFLIKEQNIPSDNILAVTFTNKAAKEMQQRLEFLLGNSNGCLSATFHSLCLIILKEQGISVNLIDDDDRKFLINEVVKKLKKAGKDISFSSNIFKDIIMSAKQLIIGPDEQLDSILSDDLKNNARIFRDVYQEYQKILSENQLYDYEDLIFHVVKLLENNQEIADSYRNRFKYIFIDEYQDLNHGQYRIVKALASLNSNIFAIGDPDQSIYGFRGSDLAYFQSFIDDYPDAKVIRLKQNYRSTETILKASWQIITKHDSDRSKLTIFSGINGINTIGIIESKSEQSEAVAIGKTIENMVGGLEFHSVDFGKVDISNACEMSFADFAVLYRTSAQGKIISEVFEKAGIPFQMFSKENIFKQKGIAQLISLLKIAEDMGSPVDFSRAGKIKIDKKAINMLPLKERLYTLKENDKIISMLQNDTKSLDAFEKLIELAQINENDTYKFITDISLQTDIDTCNFEAEKVNLMTMHSAKGLEFPVVFIAGCEQDYLPYKRSEDAFVDMDEERRLFYVAMTRAKESLFLTYSTKRRIYGKILSRKVSPFVYDIELSLKNFDKLLKKEVKKKKEDKQLTLF